MSLPHNFRLRPDLIVEPYDEAGTAWIIKDPVSLRFYLFGSDEQFVLRRLDGTCSMRQIIEDFKRNRAPKRLTFERLQSFIAVLHRNGLACSDAPQQGQILLERAAEHRNRERSTGWLNLLAVRLPGFNPNKALDWLYARAHWVFSNWCVICAALIAAYAILLLLSNWKALQLQIPRVENFLSAGHLCWLAIAVAISKCLHELGHGLACRHFGARCHEFGVMFLVGIPCLYCNVTDAWMLRNKAQRMAISAAGIVVELFLASLAVIAWRYTEAGTFNSICLYIMLVCGVSTFVFNGNPLLKYDGYYILSDLVGMPNLWQESRRKVNDLITGMLTNTSQSRINASEGSFPLIAYAVSSTVYRVCLTCGILIFLYRALYPKGMDLLVWILVTSLVMQQIFFWSVPVTRWWRSPDSMKQLNKPRSAAVAVIFLALVAAASLLPLPTRVSAPVTLQLRGAANVFVTTPGFVSRAIGTGERVEQGQTLATLTNREIQDQRMVTAGDLVRSRARVRTLQLRLTNDTQVASHLAVANEILSDVTEQLRLRDEELQALEIKAPRSGVIFLPPEVRQFDSEGQDLPQWTGTPLDVDNIGCYLERGTLLCVVGDPKRFEAIVLVDEADISYVRLGDTAEIMLEYNTERRLQGHVIEIAEVNAESVPSELAGELQGAHTTGADASKPVRTLYQARVELADIDIPLLIGAHGTAKIFVAPQTAAAKIAHWARCTFSANPKL